MNISLSTKPMMMMMMMMMPMTCGTVYAGSEWNYAGCICTFYSHADSTGRWQSCTSNWGVCLKLFIFCVIIISPYIHLLGYHWCIEIMASSWRECWL